MVDHVEPVATDFGREMDLDGNAIAMEATGQHIRRFLPNIIRIVIGEDVDASYAEGWLEPLQIISGEHGPGGDAEELVTRQTGFDAFSNAKLIFRFEQPHSPAADRVDRRHRLFARLEIGDIDPLDALQ